jgi:hypothetical protein
VSLYADHERQVWLAVSIASKDKKEVKMMQNDLYWAEWEMDYRVTSARGERQRDKLVRQCLAAPKAESSCRRKRGDLRAARPFGLVNQLRAAVSEVLRPLWGNSLQDAGRGS